MTDQDLSEYADVEAALTRAFEQHAPTVRISDDAMERIAAKTGSRRTRRRATRALAVAAAVTVAVGAMSLASNGGRHDATVVVGAATLPEATVTYFAPRGMVAGPDLAVDGRGICVAAHRVQTRIVCDKGMSKVYARFGGNTNKADEIRVVTTTDEDVIPTVASPFPMTTVPPTRPGARGRIGNPEVVQVQGHEAQLEHLVGDYWLLSWKPSANVQVAIDGNVADAVIAAGNALEAHSTPIEYAVQTNSYDITQYGSLSPLPLPPDLAHARFGLTTKNGRLCYGAIFDIGQPIANGCSPVTLGVPIAEHSDGGDDASGTVRPDAVSVRVHYSDGTTTTTAVGGAELGFGSGFWAAPPSLKAPVLAEALDAHGSVLASTKLHGAIADPAPGLHAVQQGSVEKTPFTLSAGRVEGRECGEISLPSTVNSFFCDAPASGLLAASLVSWESESAWIARLGANVASVGLEHPDGSTTNLSVTTLPETSLRIAIARVGDKDVFVGRNAEGRVVARLSSRLSAGRAYVSSAAATMAAGTANGRAWQVVFVNPVSDATLADALAQHPDIETVCLGAGYGAVVPTSCLSRSVINVAMQGNAAGVVAVPEPSLFIGSVATAASRMRVNYADGTSTEVATRPFAGLRDANGFVIEAKPGVAVRSFESLDSNGLVIGTTTTIWPAGI